MQKKIMFFWSKNVNLNQVFEEITPNKNEMRRNFFFLPKKKEKMLFIIALSRLSCI